MNRLIRLFRWPLKLGFFKKITAHVIIVTLVAGISIAVATAFQFRQELYRVEYDTAYMVYSALVSHLNNHYDRYGAYVPRTLDHDMLRQFMHLGAHADHELAHRPTHVVIYDQTGRIRYEYAEQALDSPAEELTPVTLPVVPSLQHEGLVPFVEVTGPIDPGAPERGYVAIMIPTSIRDQLIRLVTQSALILLIVLTVTILLSLIFTRQVLAPIRTLTLAARAVHRGDFTQQVKVMTDDEIGELTTTFNDMIFAMDRRMNVMHRMQDWAVRIGRQMDTKRLFEALGEMFERMSAADSYRLYLRDADADRLVTRLEYGADRLPSEEKDSLARMALRERWTMYLKENGTADNEPTDVSELAIPLLSGKHRVGVIRIGRKHDRSLYDDDTLTILQTLAQHASVAIDNANLYQRLAAQERMAQEMTLARQIQQHMLPASAPNIEGYEIAGGSAPALEVGGDYFDYIQPHHNNYIMIGDVSGKGVPAALVMSIVRAMIRAYLEFEDSPANMLRKVNRTISLDLEQDMFVTMSGLQLDEKEHRLTVSRAGHEPVLVCHRDGTLEQLTPPGAALGMLDADDFDQVLAETSYTMQPGDTVLLYTDGITEAQNTAHEEFGTKRLEQFVQQHADLSARELFERIIDEVHSFTTGVPQLDDITLVVIRRT